MKPVMVRYKVKAYKATENEGYIKNVFELPVPVELNEVGSDRVFGG